MLTPPQLLALFNKHGFPLWQAIAMGAIALRESGGPGAKAADPTVHNVNTVTLDDSYGLCQINMAFQSVAKLLESKIDGLAANHAMLLDPDVNAQAAFILWDNDDRNLNVAWYINKSKYQAAFESHLPAMMQAALAAQITT